MEHDLAFVPKLTRYSLGQKLIPNGTITVISVPIVSNGILKQVTANVNELVTKMYCRVALGTGTIKHGHITLNDNYIKSISLYGKDIPTPTFDKVYTLDVIYANFSGADKTSSIFYIVEERTQ